MTRPNSDLSARCGTVEDLTNLVSMYAQLEASAKGQLWVDALQAIAAHRVKDFKAVDGKSLGAAEWLAALPDAGHSDWDYWANWIVGIRRLMAVGLCGSTSEITMLLRLYGWLIRQPAGGWSVLVGAAETLAQQRVHGLVDTHGDAVEVHDWLSDLAEDAFPSDDLVGELLLWARDGGMDIEGPFMDHRIDFVLRESSDDAECGQGMYDVYEEEVSLLSAYQRPATAQEFFGINVSESDYRTFDGENWVVDQEARRAEVDRLCAERFIEFVGCWRESFFQLLISGTLPDSKSRQ